MKKKTFMLTAIVIVLLACVISVGSAVYLVYSNLRAMADETIPEPNLSALADGVYEGECRVFPIEVRVRVTVESQKITEVQLVRISPNRSGVASVAEAVVETQTLNVGTVPGETFTSKAIIKAVSNALSRAPVE